MKLGIMQPYFFPYAQQFRHIAQCEQWIVFDTVKFSRKSWTSRNRVANRDTEWSYISVPVAKGATNGNIAQAEIGQTDWRSTFFNQLRSYEAVAPYYLETIGILRNCIEADVDTLGTLNTRILRTIASSLGVQTEIKQLSELELELPTAAEPGEWALIISKQMGASVYSNAPGGRHLFDSDRYLKNGVTLEFYEPAPLEYPTVGLPFVPDLAVIDTLMWLGRDGVSQFVLS